MGQPAREDAPGRRTAVPLALAAALGMAIGYLGLQTWSDPVPAGSTGDGLHTATDAAGAPHDTPARAPAPPAPEAPPVSQAHDAAGVLAAPSETGTLSEAEQKNRDAVERAEAGDWTAAVTLLREARSLEPANELYVKNLRAALTNAAFAEIAAERFDAAIARFVEALRLGDRGEIRRGLGYAYYKLGNLDLARSSLERAVEQGAGDAETFVTLGQIYLERRDQRRALDLFDQALAAGSERPGLAETVARLRRDAEAEQGFESLASSHFVLKFEGRENAAAGRVVLNTLEDAYRRVGARFAYYPLDRLEVVLYPDQAFREVTSSPHWSGGVFDGRIKLPIGGLSRGSERVTRTLRHEYAHAAIVTLSRGKAPVWLNEGLAQVAEESGDEGRGGRLRAALAAGGLLPLSTLASGFMRFSREQASLAYAEAYFAAAYLLEKKGSYNVRRLLEAFATAESTDAAFRQALGLSYDEFERQFTTDVPRRLG